MTASSVPAQSDPSPAEAPPTETTDREATTLAAAGDDHLWLVRTTQRRFILMHRGPETAEDVIYRIGEVPGRPTAAAARDGRLDLAFEDRSVRRFRYEPADGARSGTLKSEALPPLPSGAKLIGWATAEPGPLALLRTEAGSAPGSADGDAAEANTTSDGIRLLRLRHGRWGPIDPPQDLDPRRVRLLVAPGSGAGGPALLSETGDGSEPGGLRVHRHRDGGWETERYGLPLRRGAQAVAVHRNLFLIQPIEGERVSSSAEDSAELGIWWLRRGEARSIGPTVAGPGAEGSWWAFSRDENVLLLRRDSDGGVRWTSCNVTAEEPTVGSWQALEVTEPPVPLPDPALVAIAIALVVGVFFLFITAQRDPQATIPKLPKDVRAAGLNRCFAAAVDLVPPLLLSMAVFQITNPIELFVRWPADSSTDWSEALPGLLVIGTHALHTFLGETLTGRTLGKALFACRVTNLSGDRPAPWQVLIRNLFKVVEMTVPLLLILPLLRIPHHQRLGDLIAGTVVIQASSTSTDTDTETPEE